MNEWSETEINEFLNEKGTGMIYFYTPFCGTCKMASKMLDIVEQLLPEMAAGKSNLNFLPQIAEQFAVESVPCLIILREGQLVEKVYAFRSVPFLHEKFKQCIY
ncbi:thioredoxin family protein [Bacillus sp. T33-2]|uniref:thioredoxin family protein n=1 Tax=Bacillus sp. T33-2 TaxID=2054168 RepID=UPI000C75749D|nr:thioredoxin family protein [Bacillus sp. T33-2]PLR92597.1 thiol reductase thioredoxin [Bacillus sp. T33-2]